ncbi:MAG TPA: SRPBCC family protein [Propionibacteriaceae bacterium]|nr:SRPBCC family protein [Propionibacteriaceae bacterium]
MTEQRRLQCAPEQVFAVLNDGWTYPLWVVGASRMRDVDDGWPAPGSKLHHSFGVWPALIDDTTEVLEIEPDKRLVLEARGWPIGKARVEITVEADGDGSLVTITEDATGGPVRLVPEPLRQATIDFRNRETLRRLGYLAEGSARGQADISERSGSAET